MLLGAGADQDNFETLLTSLMKAGLDVNHDLQLVFSLTGKCGGVSVRVSQLRGSDGRMAY